MPGSRRGKKRDQPPPPQKEKKGVSQAEIWADNRAMGQWGMASAASVRATYSLKMVCGRRSKAEIAAEFWARNALEQNDTLARHNRLIYQKFHDDHNLRWTKCSSIFWRGKVVADSQPFYSLSKNQLEKEKWGPKEEVPERSMNGDSTDYDTEGDESMKKVLETLPPLTALPLAPSISQLPATGSGAGLQKPPLPPTPLPTTSKAEQASLSRKAIHRTPPASESEQEVRAKQSLSPSIQALFDRQEKQEAEQKKVAEKKKKRQVVLEAEKPGTALPGMAPAKPGAGAAISEEQLQVVQDTLDATKGLVPLDALQIPRITPPQELISLLLTLPQSPEPNPLIAPKEMLENFMEQEEVGSEKQAGVEEVEVVEVH